MRARCPRDKETNECRDPGCACVECKHGTCGCESFTGCGEIHRKQNKEIDRRFLLRKLREEKEEIA